MRFSHPLNSFPAFRRILLSFSLGIFFLPAAAQLRADFIPDKNGGCLPLSVSFSNTTTGASANATWHWDFGNGNSSALKDAGALFSEERLYTVTLTVKDGTQTAVQSKTITVYKKPTVDFAVAPAKGCLPFPVTFTSSSSAGDGNISSYHWDFGDGSTLQSSNSSTVHNYTFEQTAGVSLTVVNNYGCASTLTRANLITVLPSLEVGFIADKTIACNAPATVAFTSNSTGPGTLSYQWDFGDGGRSAQANPVHVYTRRGTYTVKLTVTSSEGCTKEFVRNAYINIADFTTTFEESPLVCTNVNTVFNNTSQPLPVQSVWLIDGVHAYTSYGNNSISHFFTTEGTHTVQLSNNFGLCQQSITRQVEVKRSPELNGFIADIAGNCGAPVTVNFKDTTRDAVSWKWNFNWWYNNAEVHSTVQTPSYNYTADNIYTVSLTIANASGCQASVSQTVGISKPLVGIFLDPDSREEGCGPWTVKFNSRSTEPLTSYAWNFGDGGTSTLAEPVHIFNAPGNYTVTLTYKTVSGCTGSVSYHRAILVRQKPVADFTIQSAVCGNTPVFPVNTSTGYVYNYIWNFGDNTGNQGVPVHQYQQEGEYTVTLVANNEMCNDTITKTAVIKVSAPFAQIERAENTCNGTRGEIIFTDGSRQVNSWQWDFGDGSPVLSYTTARPTVAHTYARTGTYKVMLTTVNGACTVKDSVTVYVLLKQKPVLSFNTAENCVNTQVGFHITGLERNPSPYNYANKYDFRKMEYSDGTTLAGNYYVFNYWETEVHGNLTSYEIRDDRIRTVIVSAHFGCEDTTNYVPVKFKGSDAGFEIVSDNVCYKSPVVLRDTSKSSAGNPIVSWQWNFGDGNVQTFTQGGTVSHVYANPGAYYVSLQVTDQSGCVSNNSAAAYVQVTGPKAAFATSSGSAAQLNTTVTFYNYTNTHNTTGVTYLWNFGNGITSADYSPSYTYTVAGDYVITLIAGNAQTQCRDTVRQTITVRNFNTGFTTSASFIGNYGQCPPVLARFVNTSSNYTRVVWDFGDGVTLENQNSPAHIYNSPGTYIVTLFVYGYNGLTGTYRDTVRVTTPQASIHADDLEGCIGHNVLLHAPVHDGAVSYLWDFGNGQLVNAADSFATHQYLAPGSFAPSLIVKNAGGCASSITLTDKIIIHSDPIISVSPAEPVICKGVPVQLQANGGLTYQWSPAAGLSDPSIASPLASPPATATYLLDATDANGCKGKGSITVVVAKPFTLQVPGSFNVCKDSSVQLSVTGAHTYQWINNTQGLSNTQIPNPLAAPSVNTMYTVVGHDQYQCYSNTADITVFVRPHPSVSAGPDREVVYGSENTLNIASSSDVVRWNWSPTDFLSCVQCPAPVTRPYSSMDYVVTVYNSFNCAAKDTVRIKAFCEDGNIYTPTAFTPNRDGKNDVFTIYGSGVSIIRSLRVYNRWGEIVFVKKDFYPNDNSSAWNGIYKGVEAPAGTYVYFVEMECMAGERFERKGTVTLVR